jgi:hypothetical protein
LSDYRLIPLTQGQFAIVDEADYDWLMQWRWIAARNSAKTNIYYAKRRVRLDEGKIILLGMHNLILDTEKGKVGDHWNGDTLDNRRCNLRQLTFSENLRNRLNSVDRSNAPAVIEYTPPSEFTRPLSVRNTTGYENVIRWKDEQWASRIVIRGRTYSLGVFDTAEAANEAYQEAKSKAEQNPRYRPTKPLSKQNTSGHRGISWHKAAQKWRAVTSFRVDGKKRHIHIGAFTTKREAISAYRKYMKSREVADGTLH